MTKLADELGLTSKDVGPNVIAAGMLVSLWLWAAQNATDGDLSECTDRAIAEAAEFKRKPSLFVEALICAKLLDKDRKLHDWDEYATLLIDCEDRQREKTRERVAKHRAKKRALIHKQQCQYCGGEATGYDHIVPTSKGGPDKDDNKVLCCIDCNRIKGDRPVLDFLNENIERIDRDVVTKNEKLMRFVSWCNVTNRYIATSETQSNAPTIPYNTIPNHTIPNFSGDAADSARETASEAELLSIGIKPGEYYGLTVDYVREVRKTTFDLFDKYRPQIHPEPWDFRQVSQYCGSVGRAQLLDYAFEQSGVAGKLGDWRYINGIMDRMFMRGIETEAQARMWGNERPDREYEE